MFILHMFETCVDGVGTGLGDQRGRQSFLVGHVPEAGEGVGIVGNDHIHTVTLYHAVLAADLRIIHGLDGFHQRRFIVKVAKNAGIVAVEEVQVAAAQRRVLHPQCFKGFRAYLIVGTGKSVVLIVLKLKDRHTAIRRRTVPIASARRLYDRFQRGQLAQQYRKGDVHTGLDTTGGHQKGRHPCVQAASHLVQHRSPVCHAQVRAEQVDTLVPNLAKRVEHEACDGAGVDDHQCLWRGLHTFDALQLYEGIIDNEREVPTAIDMDDRLRVNTAWVDYHGAAGGYRHLIGIAHIPEWRRAAKVHSEGAVRIPPEDFLERDLVGNPRMVESPRTIGEGHRAATLEPARYGGYAIRVADEAGGGQGQIVIHVVALQRGQASRPAGDLRLRAPLLWHGDMWLLGDIDPVLRAAHPVPFKPVVHVHTSYAILRPRPRCCVRVSVAISTARSWISRSLRM